MTNTNEVSLLKAVQAVIDSYDVWRAKSGSEPRLQMETLRQAVEQAKVVEAVGTICLTPVVFNHDANIFECVIQYELPHKPKQGDLLYTTPPSVEQAKGVSAEPVAWRFWVTDHPAFNPFWTGWFTRKEDAERMMKLHPKYECAYPTPPSVEAVEEQYKCCKVFDDGDVSYAWATETEIENMHKWEKVVPEVKRNLYTTPPSIYALIAQAIEKHDEKMTVIKTVNTRKIAQPYIDELIAEIDGLGINFDCTDEQSYQNRIVYWEDIKSILDKYRSK